MAEPRFQKRSFVRTEKLKPVEDGCIECLNCNKILSSKKSARQHYKILHLNKRFTCSVCSQGFAGEYWMKKHIKVAHMLSKRAENEENEKYELKVVKPNKDGHFNCLDCCKTFSSINSAKSHHKHMHMTYHDAFKCDVCLKNFKYERSLERHIELHTDKRFMLFSRSGIKPSTRGVSRPSKGGRPGQNGNSRQQTKKPPTIGKSWEKKLALIESSFVKCLDCNKSYSSMQSAKKHFKEVHLKLISFKCLHCEKSFTQKGNLKVHVKNIHKKAKDYVCKFCGDAFAQKINLKVHVDKKHSIINA
jgi:KRAB domain-containing zinc finger protein